MNAVMEIIESAEKELLSELFDNEEKKNKIRRAKQKKKVNALVSVVVRTPEYV